MFASNEAMIQKPSLIKRSTNLLRSAWHLHTTHSLTLRDPKPQLFPTWSRSFNNPTSSAICFASAAAFNNQPPNPSRNFTTAAAAASTGPYYTPPPVIPSNYLNSLSDEQIAAVTAPLGETRVIAGPGSGKTRVLISRIAHLIAAHNAQPWQIVSITFTNKAADEMKERLETLLGHEASHQMFAGTFHSLCYRILRRGLTELPNTGRTEGWSLYDEEAAQSVMYKLIKAEFPEWKAADVKEKGKEMHSIISALKNSLVGFGVDKGQIVEAFYMRLRGGVLENKDKAAIRDVTHYFELYESTMRANNALDFDDLLSMSVTLLRQSQEVRHRLRRKFRHVLCDEFQDTNNPQYELLKLITGVEPKNDVVALYSGREVGPADLFVVGDPDQAIYGWRGADVGNMRREFDIDYPDATTFYLRDNYRSTKGILSAAQAVIAKNKDWDRLSLNAKLGAGAKIQIRYLDTNHEEATHIAEEISDLINLQGVASESIAVLFRIHRQVRLVEKELVSRNIPYVLIGGLPFWRRTEIQDLMAYIRLAVTLEDPVALDRVINVPKRGLGPASLAKLEASAAGMGLTQCQLLFGTSVSENNSSSSDSTTTTNNDGIKIIPGLPDAKTLGLSAKAYGTLQTFRDSVLDMRKIIQRESLAAGLQSIIESVHYEQYVMEGGCGGKEGDEVDRMSRIEQLVEAARQFVPGSLAGTAVDEAFTDDFSSDDATSIQSLSPKNNDDSKNLEGLEFARAFLDEAALYSGHEEVEKRVGVRLMTMHAAKGLEFDIVFVPGCNEGLVPFSSSKYDNFRSNEIDLLHEETRLFFVSMTRAKKSLMLTHTQQTIQHGGKMVITNTPSRFLAEVKKSGHFEENYVESSSSDSNSNFGGASAGSSNNRQSNRRAAVGRFFGNNDGSKKKRTNSDDEKRMRNMKKGLPVFINDDDSDSEDTAYDPEKQARWEALRKKKELESAALLEDKSINAKAMAARRLKRR